MLPTERFERLEVTRIAQLRDWLAANHDRTEGVWLVTWMKAVPDRYVDRWAVLDELLCFGWIDGLRRKGEAGRTLQLITPRRQQAWAQSYKDRVARLEADGRMAEPGRAAIARARGVSVSELVRPFCRLCRFRLYIGKRRHTPNRRRPYPQNTPTYGWMQAHWARPLWTSEAHFA